ncbi:hypothetical protein HDU80_001568, partial [Chytriomyces hyalinus]
MAGIPDGYEVRSIRPNGNCFFAAIAYSLSIGQNPADGVSPGAIRNFLVERLLQLHDSAHADGATIADQEALDRTLQLTEFESIAHLVDALHDDGTERGWGSTNFLIPLGEILGLRFIIYSPQLPGGEDFSLHPQFQAPAGILRTVRLSYAHNHFDVVVDQ